MSIFNDKYVIYDPESIYNPLKLKTRKIIEEIKEGKIKLPVFQRNFVWKRTQIIDFIQNFFVGLPIGRIILWEINRKSDYYKSARNISKEENTKFEVINLVLDGQQRLSSLLSILTKNNIIFGSKWQHLEIVYNPIKVKFAFSNKNNENDPRWIPLHTIYSNDFKLKENKDKFCDKYIQNLIALVKKGKMESLDVTKEVELRSRIKDLFRIPERMLKVVTLTDSNIDLAFQLLRSANIGTPFNRSDMLYAFISHVSEEIGEKIRNFNRDLIEGFSFELSIRYIVRLLILFQYKENYYPNSYYNKNFDDLAIKALTQSAKFLLNKELFKEFLIILNVESLKWLKALKLLEFNEFAINSIIKRKSIYIVCYCYYSIGVKFSVNIKKLNSFIGKWFIFSILTRRYDHLEYELEREFAQIADFTQFIEFLEQKIQKSVNSDFWEISMPKLIINITSNRNDILQIYFLTKASKNIAFSRKYQVIDYFSNSISNPDKKKIKRFKIFSNILENQKKIVINYLKSAANNMILDLGTSSSQKISKLNYPSEWGRFLGTFDNKIDLKIINPTFQEWDFPNSLQDEEKIFSDSKDDFLEYFINFLEIRSRLMAGKLKRIFLETLED